MSSSTHSMTTVGYAHWGSWTPVSRSSGQRDVNAYAFETVRGRTGPTMLEGRPIHGDDEVVLGAGTARELDVGVGDEVTVRGDEQRHRLEVVGLAALPVLDDRSGVDIGAIMSPRRLRSVAPDDSLNHDVLVRWASGVDAAAGMRRLERTSDSEVFSARLPSELANLERVRALPWALAALLAVVALLAIVHAVVSTVRRRRRDLAVLRTLGLVDRQLSALVRWEASTFAAIGLVFGIPLGLVAGRVVWHQVAAGIGVDATATMPVLPLLVVALASWSWRSRSRRCRRTTRAACVPRPPSPCTPEADRQHEHHSDDDQQEPRDHGFRRGGGRDVVAGGTVTTTCALPNGSSEPAVRVMSTWIAGAE